MGKSEPAFACINAKSVVSVQRWVNKVSDMPVLVKVQTSSLVKGSTFYCNAVKY